MPQTVTSRVGGALVSAVLGAVVALVGTVVHQLAVGERRWPLGLLTALALTGLWGMLLGRAPWPAVVRAAGVVGWVVLVAVVASRRPEGDVLVPANGRGYGWMLGGLVTLVAPVVLAAGTRAPARG